jgi:hypothetical protein
MCQDAHVIRCNVWVQLAEVPRGSTPDGITETRRFNVGWLYVNISATLI